MTKTEFNAIINGNDVAVIKFGAEWCNPCKAMEPILDEAAEQLKNKAAIVSIDVEESPELATEYRVRNVPTILYFKNGEVIDKSVGSINLDSLMERINKLF